MSPRRRAAACVLEQPRLWSQLTRVCVLALLFAECWPGSNGVNQGTESLTLATGKWERGPGSAERRDVRGMMCTNPRCGAACLLPPLRGVLSSPLHHLESGGWQQMNLNPSHALAQGRTSFPGCRYGPRPEK